MRYINGVLGTPRTAITIGVIMYNVATTKFMLVHYQKASSASYNLQLIYNFNSLSLYVVCNHYKKNCLSTSKGILL